MRARDDSGVVSKKKKGDQISTKVPTNDKCREYVKASAQHYGRYLADEDAEDWIPENEAHKQISAMAVAIAKFQKDLADESEADYDKRPEPVEIFRRLYKRTAFMLHAEKYMEIQRSASEHRKSGQKDPLDAMDHIPPITHQNVVAAIQEVYRRGLLTPPKITTTEHEDIFKDFEALLPDSQSIQQYIATKERDMELLQQSLDDGSMPTSGPAADEKHFEDLKQCHALLGLMPARSPINMSFVQAMKYLGWLHEKAEGDAKYTDLRVDRRDKEDGTPMNPGGISLTPFQVVGKLNNLAPIGATVYTLIGTNWCQV